MSDPITIAKNRARARIVERRILLSALKRNGWNVGATARELMMWTTSLRRAIKAHGLEEQHKAHGRKAGRPMGQRRKT